MSKGQKGTYLFCQLQRQGDGSLVYECEFYNYGRCKCICRYFWRGKTDGVILSHWGFFENPEGEESLFTACLTKNGICDKLEKRYYLKGMTKRHVHVVTSISSDVA